MPRRPDMPPLAAATWTSTRSRSSAPGSTRAEREVAAARGDDAWRPSTPTAPPTRGWCCSRASTSDGFRFFTNHESAKGEQLAAPPRAALVVYWRELDRQVRVRGPVERLADAESDAYFATRPRDSQLGAWASPQSRPLASAPSSTSALDEVEARFADGEVPRPAALGRLPAASRTRSSSGRARSGACTTASATRASARRLADRAPRALDAGAQRPASRAANSSSSSRSSKRSSARIAVPRRAHLDPGAERRARAPPRRARAPPA